MREIQYIRCLCCGKLSRAKNFNLDAIHDFGIWISSFGGRGCITWEKRILSDEEVGYLKQKFALQLEAIYFRLTGKKLDAENDFEEMESVEVRELGLQNEILESLQVQEMVSKNDSMKPFLVREFAGQNERLNFKKMEVCPEWRKEKIAKVNLRDARL